MIAKTCVILHIYFYGSIQMKFQVSKLKVNKLNTNTMLYWAGLKLKHPK